MKKEIENERERDLLRRLAAAGIPVQVPIGLRDGPDLLIRQDPELYNSELFDNNHGTGLILPLKIVSNLSTFILSAVCVKFERWTEALIQPIEPVDDPAWPRYEFYDSSLKFNRDEVINTLLRRSYNAPS